MPLLHYLLEQGFARLWECHEHSHGRESDRVLIRKVGVGSGLGVLEMSYC